MRKATFLLGFATGYVLGAKAGRGRYEQIMQASRTFLGSPVVQTTAHTLQHQATDALHTAKDKASDALHERRPSWLGGHEGHPVPAPGQTVTNGFHG